MDDINLRLNQIADYYGLKRYADFAERTGLSHQTASNYMKGKGKPDVAKLAKIKKSFDNVSSEWLLTGKGDMLLDPQKEGGGTPIYKESPPGQGRAAEPVVPYHKKPPPSEVEQAFIEQLREKDKQIAFLQDQVKAKDDQLTTKDKLISELSANFKKGGHHTQGVPERKYETEREPVPAD